MNYIHIDHHLEQSDVYYSNGKHKINVNAVILVNFVFIHLSTDK
jgi:hypothetical protein